MLLFLFTPVAKYSPSHVLDIVISFSMLSQISSFYKCSAPLEDYGRKIGSRGKAMFLVIAALLYVLLYTTEFFFCN